MLSTTRTVSITTYASEVIPSITSEAPSDQETIAWADAHPVVWKIVRESRSAPFGKGSSTYVGWAQKLDTPNAVIERARAFREALEENLHHSQGFWSWRARFTLEHYGQKGFKGGFFQQWDGKYGRGCTSLDYTPGTREEVLTRFQKWCDDGPCRFESKALLIDGVTVRGTK